MCVVFGSKDHWPLMFPSHFYPLTQPRATQPSLSTLKGVCSHLNVSYFMGHWSLNYLIFSLSVFWHLLIRSVGHLVLESSCRLPTGCQQILEEYFSCASSFLSSRSGQFQLLRPSSHHAFPVGFRQWTGQNVFMYCPLWGPATLTSKPHSLTLLTQFPVLFRCWLYSTQWCLMFQMFFLTPEVKEGQMVPGFHMRNMGKWVVCLQGLCNSSLLSYQIPFDVIKFET